MQHKIFNKQYMTLVAGVVFTFDMQAELNGAVNPGSRNFFNELDPDYNKIHTRPSYEGINLSPAGYVRSADLQQPTYLNVLNVKHVEKDTIVYRAVFTSMQDITAVYDEAVKFLEAYAKGFIDYETIGAENIVKAGFELIAEGESLASLVQPQPPTFVRFRNVKAEPPTPEAPAPVPTQQTAPGTMSPVSPDEIADMVANPGIAYKVMFDEAPQLRLLKSIDYETKFVYFNPETGMYVSDLSLLTTLGVVKTISIAAYALLFEAADNVSDDASKAFAMFGFKRRRLVDVLQLGDNAPIAYTADVPLTAKQHEPGTYATIIKAGIVPHYFTGVSDEVRGRQQFLFSPNLSNAYLFPTQATAESMYVNNNLWYVDATVVTTVITAVPIKQPTEAGGADTNEEEQRAELTHLFEAFDGGDKVHETEDELMNHLLHIAKTPEQEKAFTEAGKQFMAKGLMSVKETVDLCFPAKNKKPRKGSKE